MEAETLEEFRSEQGPKAAASPGVWLTGGGTLLLTCRGPQSSALAGRFSHGDPKQILGG